MFGAEPQERLSNEELAQFEGYVAQRHRKTLKNAAIAGIALLINILWVPFLAGHSLHDHWNSVGKYLVITAEALLLWFVLKLATVYASWQSAKETRSEFCDPE